MALTVDKIKGPLMHSHTIELKRIIHQNLTVEDSHISAKEMYLNCPLSGYAGPFWLFVQGAGYMFEGVGFDYRIQSGDPGNGITTCKISWSGANLDGILIAGDVLSVYYGINY